MSTATASGYNYQAACEAADDYLHGLGLHPLGEVEPNVRLLLARILIEELPLLEAATQGKFREARAELFDTINCALNSFDSGTEEWPSAADFAMNLGLIGCRDKNARVSLKRILSRLNENQA